METLVKIHSRYNYEPRRCGGFLDVVTVDVVDTSVDNVKNNISVAGRLQSKPFYTNSDTPTPIFGPGITAVHYDPSRHRGAYAAKEQPAAAAAAATPSPSAVAAAANSAAAAVPSSNAATVNQ